MKRLVLGGAILLTLATVVPAAGVESGDWSGCTATTGAALLDQTGPTCTFELRPDGPTFYMVTLDANGTGVVSGSMIAEQAFPIAAPTVVAWVDVDTSSATGPPTCGPAPFECHYASSDDTAILLVAPSPDTGSGGAAKVTCSTGTAPGPPTPRIDPPPSITLAAIASVSCSATVIAFGLG
jgi:hypothetical protein